MSASSWTRTIPLVLPLANYRSGDLLALSLADVSIYVFIYLFFSLSLSASVSLCLSLFPSISLSLAALLSMCLLVLVLSLWTPDAQFVSFCFLNYPQSQLPVKVLYVCRYQNCFLHKFPVNDNAYHLSTHYKFCHYYTVILAHNWFLLCAKIICEKTNIFN